MPRKPANSYLKPPGIKLHQNGSGGSGGDANGQQSPKLSCTVAVLFVSSPRASPPCAPAAGGVHYGFL